MPQVSVAVTLHQGSLSLQRGHYIKPQLVTMQRSTDHGDPNLTDTPATLAPARRV